MSEFMIAVVTSMKEIVKALIFEMYQKFKKQ